MIEALAGQQWLSLGLVVDLFGSDLSLSTIGIAVAAVAAKDAPEWRPVITRHWSPRSEHPPIGGCHGHPAQDPSGGQGRP